MKRVEYKDTLILKFITKQRSNSTGEIIEVTPTTFSAYLETCEIEPTELAEITGIQTVDDSTYLVRFYADESTYTDLEPGDTYYVSFYWEFDGVKRCERIKVVIATDV